MAVSNHHSDYTPAAVLSTHSSEGTRTGSEWARGRGCGPWGRGTAAHSGLFQGKVAGSMNKQTLLTSLCSSSLLIDLCHQQNNRRGSEEGWSSGARLGNDLSAAPSRLCAHSPTHWLHP